MNNQLLEKYAELIVRTGANVQKSQPVVINCATDQAYFARLVTKEAYRAGASRVTILWSDELITKLNYENMDIEEVKNIPEWRSLQYQSFANDGVAVINLISDTPGLLKDIDPLKLHGSAMASAEAFKSFREYTMGNKGQWTIAALASPKWANIVFPNDDLALEKMWQAIFNAVRVSADNNPVEAWRNHNERLDELKERLNDYNFKELHFSNSLGTDLTIGLVDNHLWAAGSETTTTGVEFNPNLPTEECFTMPHREKINGTVVATIPLSYQGKLIEDMRLTFKDGKVVDFSSSTAQDVLENILNTDEGSASLGEVALISYDSPIQETGILFYNTLFDENASCHLALGAAYPMNIEGGLEMSEKELLEKGFNQSNVHVDFMFGSRDMSIIGVQHDGKEVVVFKEGNFVF